MPFGGIMALLEFIMTGNGNMPFHIFTMDRLGSMEFLMYIKTLPMVGK
jgi:hypothetical protein